MMPKLVAITTEAECDLPGDDEALKVIRRNTRMHFAKHLLEMLPWKKSWTTQKKMTIVIAQEFNRILQVRWHPKLT